MRRLAGIPGVLDDEDDPRFDSFVQTTKPGSTVLSKRHVVPVERRQDLTRTVEELEFLVNDRSVSVGVLTDKLRQARRSLMATSSWSSASYATDPTYDAPEDLAARLDAVQAALNQRSGTMRGLGQTWGRNPGFTASCFAARQAPACPPVVINCPSGYGEPAGQYPFQPPQATQIPGQPAIPGQPGQPRQPQIPGQPVTPQRPVQQIPVTTRFQIPQRFQTVNPVNRTALTQQVTQIYPELPLPPVPVAAFAPGVNPLWQAPSVPFAMQRLAQQTTGLPQRQAPMLTPAVVSMGKVGPRAGAAFMLGMGMRGGAVYGSENLSPSELASVGARVAGRKVAGAGGAFTLADLQGVPQFSLPTQPEAQRMARASVRPSNYAFQQATNRSLASQGFFALDPLSLVGERF